MSSTFRKFALVLPTFKEAENINAVLDRTSAAMSQLATPWEILVVDDDSRDGTSEIVRHYSESEPRVRLLVRRGKRGLAGAITYGWAQTDADLIGVMDADLQHPPELLPALVEQIHNGFDVAIASRYLDSGSMAGWNPARILSRLGILASKFVQNPGLKVTDSMSGFFVLRRECIAGLEFQQSGFKLLLEILVKAKIGSVAEVPFIFASRQGGTSKANALTAIHYCGLLWRLAAESLSGRRTRPHGISETAPREIKSP